MSFPGMSSVSNGLGAARRIARSLTTGKRSSTARDMTVGQFGSGSTRASDPSVILPHVAGPTPATPYDVSPASAAVKIANAWQSGIKNRDIDAANARVAAEAQAQKDAAAAQTMKLNDLRIAGAQAALDPTQVQAHAQATEAGRIAAERANPVPVKRVAIMDSDWNRLAAVHGIPQSVVADRAANGGTLSEADYRSFQAAVDNLTATENARRMAAGASQGATQAELHASANEILQGIANGTLSPNIEMYGTNRDGMKRLLAEGAVRMGLDLNTLRQSYYAKTRALSSGNSPQQLRMRQAADNIYSLLAQMRGQKQPDGTTSPGLVDAVGGTQFPVVNEAGQWYQRQTGDASALKQFNLVASKLAMEQAFLMSAGNQPPEALYKRLLDQYKSTDNPDNILDAFDTVEQTVADYQRSIANTGEVSPSNPYSPGGGFHNPFGGPAGNLGTHPPAGTVQPGGHPLDEFVR